MPWATSSDLAILALGEGLPPMVQVDNAWGAVSTSDKPKEVSRFTRRFNQMMSVGALLRRRVRWEPTDPGTDGRGDHCGECRTDGC